MDRAEAVTGALLPDPLEAASRCAAALDGLRIDAPTLLAIARDTLLPPRADDAR